MHRCLQVAEILSVIVDALADSEDRGDLSPRKAQASMARTCKLFNEPAMNALWSSFADLGPLMKCLPSDAWEKRGRSGVIITRCPIGEDWSRFMVNASRITELRFRRSPSINHLRTIFMCLPHASSPFTNLQSLSFLGGEILLDTSPYMPVLLSPKLQRFSLNSYAIDISRSIVGSLSYQCSELNTLSIANWDEYLLAALPRFKKLRSLERRTPLLTPTIVTFLTMSSFLASLSITAPKTMPVIPCSLTNADTFPHLTTLEIYDIQDVLVTNALLRLVPAQKLYSLSLSFGDTGPLSNTQHLNTLVETISIHRLTKLTIQGDDVAKESMPQWSLSPLGHLQSLRHLSVSLSGYHWSRELLRRDLGISWSELQRIDLENSTSLSSIEILGDCALYLPDLTSLSIPIDASILPEYPVPAGRSSEPIRLVLERYPISEESWPHIAAYIAATYPKAEVSTIMLLMDELESDSEGEQEWWYEVAKMVPIMATVGWTERSLIHEGVVSVESEL